ncbi:MAG TPA: hypothetical protein VLB85_02455 [Acidimicrobiia bacterium]|nr:hypothetical protein [Acidimicrobiia bacterium]
MSSRPHVGTLREKPLHAALKRWYAEEGDRIEEPVEGFVVDIVRGETLIEIQTQGFASMKRKLDRLLDYHQLRIVHPIPVEKRILKIDDGGAIVSRRLSPKRGTVVDIFGELVSFPTLISHPGLTIEVLLTREEEVRRFDGTKAWRRRGWVVEERRLVEVVDRVVLESPATLAALLPVGLPTEFTTADLASDLGCGRRLAQQMTYCLRHVGAIEIVGKSGNSMLYSRRSVG